MHNEFQTYETADASTPEGLLNLLAGAYLAVTLLIVGVRCALDNRKAKSLAETAESLIARPKRFKRWFGGASATVVCLIWIRTGGTDMEWVEYVAHALPETAGVIFTVTSMLISVGFFLFCLSQCFQPAIACFQRFNKTPKPSSE